MALSALEDIDPNAAAPRIAAWLGKLPVDRADEARGVLAAVLGRRGGPAILARAMDKGRGRCRRPGQALHPPGPRLGPRRARAGRRAVEGRQAGIASPKALSAPEMAQLLADVARQGDPARGEEVFRRKDLTCQKCHAIAGAGGQVGPGLESIGASAQPDYLVDSILQPEQAGQGGLPRHRRGHRRRPDLHRDQAPPDRHRAGPARRRGPRGLDPGLVDRRAEDGRLAHAGGAGRRADPPRAGRPGPVPLRAGQGRTV